MIKYDAGKMGLSYIVRWKGSVFPKALIWAIPNAALALLLHIYCRQEQTPDNYMSMTGVDKLWAGYTSVLGFLVVFRNNQAYTRFWEGATLVNQIRGEWFNAVSSLFAFCNSAEDQREKVGDFQLTLVCLASLLYCSALQQVCELNDDTLEIIEDQSMDPESLAFMQNCNDRCEMILQWIQRLIVENEESKTIKIAPPLLTRAFQELSRGIVNLNNARKIKDIPFPFPYAQMITVMLIVHWATTPVIASQVIESPVMAAVVCFFVTFAFWCLIYIALEIDQPFGEDDNDLPLREMMRDFNVSLLNLMHPLAQKVPKHRPGGCPTLSSSNSAYRFATNVMNRTRITTLHRMSDGLRSSKGSSAGPEALQQPRDPRDLSSRRPLQSENAFCRNTALGRAADASCGSGSAGGASGVPGASDSDVPLKEPTEPVDGVLLEGVGPPVAAETTPSRRSNTAPRMPDDMHEARNRQAEVIPQSRFSGHAFRPPRNEADVPDGGGTWAAPAIPVAGRCTLLAGSSPVQRVERADSGQELGHL